MLSPRTIPNLLSGATLASAILAATAASADAGALDWPQADATASIVSFGGDAVSADPVTPEGGGELEPSPFSGTPASDDAMLPYASQINPEPSDAYAAEFRNKEGS
ncbi:hypothetical protein P2H44_18520 [Albimonas sp. CAU 1670]|uniref:hypothetical protein n=1 Tax=Albimonas sp. CAU 1670 TaxID=3032599 RepID=UPI0023DA5557|nr:hypothetical protein [Albimonas sp. CAU 1670]MDF2234559.1 hypothetical protein [Albimonas sp. CAU 1670]